MNSSSSNLFIGILSGTSMDAIDVALVEIAKNDYPTLVNANSYKLPIEFVEKCKKLVNSKACSLDEFGELDQEAGKLFAEAINKFITDKNLSRQNIAAIGSHGQTIKHNPNAKFPNTLQIGDPNIIAHYTNIPVVTDFRRKDLAAGGQGAPLAPILHKILFKSKDKDRIIINIGGISNITVLPKGNSNKTLGFDTGPGNCLIDLWTNKFFSKKFDSNGAIAEKGELDNNLLNLMLEDSYFTLPQPKSTGTDYFNLQWLENILKKQNKALKDSIEAKQANNILTTLTHLTAKSIANDINKLTGEAAEVYVCGGGVHNNYLITLLNRYCSHKISSSEKINLNPDWIEAILFALLAKKRLNKEKLNLADITGSSKELILGGVYAS